MINVYASDLLQLGRYIQNGYMIPNKDTSPTARMFYRQLGLSLVDLEKLINSYPSPNDEFIGELNEVRLVLGYVTDIILTLRPDALESDGFWYSTDLKRLALRSKDPNVERFKTALKGFYSNVAVGKVLGDALSLRVKRELLLLDLGIKHINRDLVTDLLKL